MGGTAVAVRKPKVRFAVSGTDRHPTPQRRIAIRHNSDDRLIALIEIISPGNKSSNEAFRSFQEKLLGALRQGLHSLVIDLFPPTRRDPAGLPSAIWKRLVGEPLAPLSAIERSLISIEVGPTYTAYVQPHRIGDKLNPMPLFVEPGRYVDVPLETSYHKAWDGIPEEVRTVVNSN